MRARTWGSAVALASALAAGCGGAQPVAVGAIPALSADGGEAHPPAVEPRPPDAAAAPAPAAAAPLTEPPAVAGPPPKVKVTIRSRPKALVSWGKKQLGQTPVQLQRPRDSGPMDLVLRARGYLPLRTRAYTFRNDTLSVEMVRIDQKDTLLGARKTPPPEPPPPPPDAGPPPTP